MVGPVPLASRAHPHERRDRSIQRSFLRRLRGVEAFARAPVVQRHCQPKDQIPVRSRLDAAGFGATFSNPRSGPRSCSFRWSCSVVVSFHGSWCSTSISTTGSQIPRPRYATRLESPLLPPAPLVNKPMADGRFEVVWDRCPPYNGFFPFAVSSASILVVSFRR